MDKFSKAKSGASKHKSKFMNDKFLAAIARHKLPNFRQSKTIQAKSYGHSSLQCKHYHDRLLSI